MKKEVKYINKKMTKNSIRLKEVNFLATGTIFLMVWLSVIKLATQYSTATRGSVTGNLAGIKIIPVKGHIFYGLQVYMTTFH